MSITQSAEELYQLLPAFYRLRDAEEGEPLKALLKVIFEQVSLMDQDISRLYRNWFIETCDEWVVPYIGDLLGVKGVHPVSTSTYSLRAFVANTIAYRRRKGTATMLEQLADDVTGWKARAVEFFQLLGTTQNINHLRLHNHRTPDLRKVDPLELLDTPFDTMAHTVDVRHIGSGRGKHNIPNLGLFLWRLQAIPIKKATAYFHNEGRYSFSPLGNAMPLFNSPETETEITHLAEEINVPAPIRRLVFRDDTASYYDKERSIFIWKNGSEVPAGNIIACNLKKWEHRPPTGMVAVDPVRGRISFPTDENPGRDKVEVRYYYGFSGEVGGGGYDRHCQAIPAEIKPYEIGKGKTFETIMGALGQWAADCAADGERSAVLLITDSRIYRESLQILIPAGITLEIRAADEQYPLLRLPRITNPLTDHFGVTGQTASVNQARAKLILNGLRICGEPIVIEAGDLGDLELRHCTLVPGLNLISVKGKSQPEKPNQESLTAILGNSGLSIYLERSICGGIKLLDTHDLQIKESIIQGLKAKAIQGPNLTVEGSTIMGEVLVRQVELASNTIFTDTVSAELKQKGCVRFSYVPPGSKVPRRHRCQPDLAIKKAIETAREKQSPLPEADKDAIIKDILAWLKPGFTDENYGAPGYAQLGRNCPVEVFAGAEDGSEMGVFRHLFQPQRLANLRASLDEYLPANMEAGIFFVN
jgi:hypothetical protein